MCEIGNLENLSRALTILQHVLSHVMFWQGSGSLGTIFILFVPLILMEAETVRQIISPTEAWKFLGPF